MKTLLTALQPVVVALVSFMIGYNFARLRDKPSPPVLLDSFISGAERRGYSNTVVIVDMQFANTHMLTILSNGAGFTIPVSDVAYGFTAPTNGRPQIGKPSRHGITKL